MKQDKKDMLWRIRLAYFAICIFGALVVFKVGWIQWVEGDELRDKAESMTIASKNIDAIRGNIYASDGSLLATSIPKYEIRMDVNADAIGDSLFRSKVDSLAYCLNKLFGDKPAREYKSELVAARNSITPQGTKGGRYHLIKRNVNYNQLKKIKTFPILRGGKYKGGLIYIQQNKREKPFRMLAERTIGYSREQVKVGLEGAYNKELEGVNGKRLMQKIAGGNWKPLNDENEIEPQNGYDLFTTIDVNIQDVAENALHKQLSIHQADHGCVVLMEVKSGEIKAIANLKRNEYGGYYEGYNYAIGESTEPGSTFKLAIAMAALEDGVVDLEYEIDTEGGKKRFYDRTMYDTHDNGVVTLKRAFEVSSNIYFAKLVQQKYGQRPDALIDRLYRMNLNNQLGVEIPGEGIPKIKNTSSNSWSGISLPWMAHGYEVLQTPLQILTFYNAVANDGVMVKPKFVTRVADKGKTIETIDTEVINDRICSRETIAKARLMLEGVVNNDGTAKNLKESHYKVAGKTGTAQIDYHDASEISHQASFVGYFPAENPKYSCIVVVNAPSRDVYYGNLVAGPIFKEVADKVYANSLEIHEELKVQSTFMANSAIPYSKSGDFRALKTVFDEFGIPMQSNFTEAQWITTSTKDSLVECHQRKMIDGLVPNVTGMGIQDALFLLENSGLKVSFSGKGIIKKQSIRPGTRIARGSTIILEMS